MVTNGLPKETRKSLNYFVFLFVTLYFLQQMYIFSKHGWIPRKAPGKSAKAHLELGWSRVAISSSQ